MSDTCAPPPAVTVERVSGACRPGGQRLGPSRFSDAGQESHDGSVKCSCKCAANPTLKRHLVFVEFLGGRGPHRKKQDTALPALNRSSELVGVVVGSAVSAPTAGANPRALMIPGGQIAPNALVGFTARGAAGQWPVRAAVSRL